MIKISKKIQDEVIRHCKSCYPQEACGFLAGKGEVAARFIPIDNMEHSSVSYAMDPKQQMRAFRTMNEDKSELLAIVHSHVASPAKPSQKDLNLAFYPDVSYVIVSLADMAKPDMKSFKIANGSYTDEELVIA